MASPELPQLKRVGFFSRLLGRKQDPLLERARTLVQAATVSAVALHLTLLDRLPVIDQADAGDGVRRKAEHEHWVFILTVAGVFIAASRLNNLRKDDTCEQRVMALVAEELRRWNPDGIRAFEECKNVFERELDRLTAAGHEAKCTTSDALGLWIVANVLGRAPQTDEECVLVRTVGVMVTHTFFDWWES